MRMDVQQCHTWWTHGEIVARNVAGIDDERNKFRGGRTHGAVLKLRQTMLHPASGASRFLKWQFGEPPY